ncbi:MULTISPECIES: hypothetical protein [unclassified Streptomyces]|uniref:hypothetical protein n=1 Tax=unclassified Streptomyces TaxID=2593676 RepID=UPI0024750ED6|nr:MULTISPECIES: hypothetical protein [unclassified Streptomyces]MDH6448856.1 hypothetical protein [Streptomyces sp. SAI-119]MDH6500563.1 hypothetical protein [Streptomyces sp. SAI-149]
MQKIQLTYWWNGHEPGDLVDVDDLAARELLGVIARPAEGIEDAEDSADSADSDE